MIRLLSLTACTIVAALMLAPVPAEAAKDKKKGHDLAAVFKKLDTDHDGKLTLAEFSKLHEIMKGKKAATATKKPNKGGGKKAGTLFSKLDTNKDGTLSFEEFKKLAELKKDKKKSK